MASNRIIFYNIIKELKIHTEFWRNVAVKLIKTESPTGQNPLNFILDVGLLSCDRIKEELINELKLALTRPENEGLLNSKISELLEFFDNSRDTYTPSKESNKPHYATSRHAPPSRISKSSRFVIDFDILIESLRISPGAYVWKIFLTEILQVYASEDHVMKYLLDKNILNKNYVDKRLIDWLSTSAYSTNGNIEMLFSYYAVTA